MVHAAAGFITLAQCVRVAAGDWSGHDAGVARRLRFRRARGAAPRFWPGRWPRRWLRILVGGRLLALLTGAALIWPTLDPALVEPPALLATGPETVDAQFSRCGRGRAHACVVDGDTFRLGKRRIRIVGIDAPEMNARCEAEKRLAEAATAKLQELLNQGPFTMTGRIDDSRDRYGRELRTLTRKRADGSTQSIAEDMRTSGLARRYLGYKARMVLK